MIIALDTETNGINFFHGSKPFFVTVCTDQGEQTFWEVDVNPLTREPQWAEEDIEEIREVINSADEIIGQNVGFDIKALHTIGISADEWPWEKTYDTLLAGHLLASNQPHDLTTMCLHYLGIDLAPYEKKLEEAVKKCRSMVQQARLKIKRTRAKGEEAELEGLDIANWRIAEKGLEEMPSAKEESWRGDYWLPRAMISHMTEEGLDSSHHGWWRVLSDYSVKDSEATILLWFEQKKLIESRGEWKLYERKRKVLPIVREMEHRGMSSSCPRLTEMVEEFTTESNRLADVMVGLADSYGYDLQLPKGATPNKSLRTFCFDILKLPAVYNSKAKSDAPTLDSKTAVPYWLSILDEKSKQALFVRSLSEKRARDTALSYMQGYERFWVPYQNGDNVWYIIHPSFNVTGTDTLRWSSKGPNAQNFSNKEDLNLRYFLGPLPGREWWSCDYSNLELRLPAYLSGEQDMIDLFEHPDKPPYYGSNHLLNFHTIYGDLWKKAEKEVGPDQTGLYCKEHFPTQYRWGKNTGFALQYSAGRETVDTTAHRIGAYDLLTSRFAKILGPGGLNQKTLSFAQKHGYINTIPDRRVDPDHGYPLMVTRTEWGRVLPTTPLSYLIQGSAGWLIQEAMIGCHEKLQEWKKRDGFDGYMAANVHDEILFDFPKSKRHPREEAEKEKAGETYFRLSNLWRIKILQNIMADCGTGIGVPTPVSCKYHEETWAKGESM